jgi:hypothetical protein
MKIGILVRRAILAGISMFVLASCSAFAQSCGCFGQLKYRAVTLGLLGDSGYNHAFWWIQLSDNTSYILDGGPADPNCPLSCGQLVDWSAQVTPTRTWGYYPEDSVYASTWYTLPVPQVGDNCSITAGMYSYAYAWNFTTSYLYALAASPNSNTFAHLVASGGGGIDVLTPPPNTVGW